MITTTRSFNHICNSFFCIVLFSDFQIRARLWFFNLCGYTAPLLKFVYHQCWKTKNCNECHKPNVSPHASSTFSARDLCFESAILKFQYTHGLLVRGRHGVRFLKWRMQFGWPQYFYCCGCFLLGSFSRKANFSAHKKSGQCKEHDWICSKCFQT